MAITDNLIVHTFLSNGLMPFAEVFVRSFKYQHGSDIPILITSVGLSKSDIDKLKGLHSNLEIRNKPLDLVDCANRLNTDLGTVTRWKSEIEEGVVTNENYHWKILMSVEERYRTLGNIAKECQSRGYRKLLHSDIDMYFRKPLSGLWRLLDECDAAIVFRPNMPEQAKVLGAFIGFRLTDKVNDFFSIWNKHMDAYSTPDKPKGYGQTSLYYAYLETEKSLMWSDLSTARDAPYLTKKHEQDAEIWIGNNDGGRITKAEAARIFLEDLDKQQKIPLKDSEKHLKSYSSKLNPSDNFYRYLLNSKQQDVDSFLLSEKGISFLALTHQLFQESKCKEGGLIFPRLSHELLNLSYVEKALDLEKLNHESLLSYLKLEKQQFDGVVSMFALEAIAIDDLVWVIDLMFSCASRSVSIYIANNSRDSYIKKRDLLPPQAWRGLFIGISSNYPDVDYLVVCEKKDGSLVKFCRESADKQSNNIHALHDKKSPTTQLGKVTANVADL